LCLQSAQSYPHAVAAATGLSLQQYACSGAKADEGIYGSQRLSDGAIDPQLNRAFAGGTPKLITLTIGANDVRWSQFIKQCYYTRCGFGVDTARFNAYLLDLRLELNITMAKISSFSRGKPPRVIITGYYNPFDSKSACGNTQGLTSKEISWLKGRLSKLNGAIQSVAGTYSNTSYAAVTFAGHELCTKEPWVQGVTDAMPFHPTAAGQQAIAQAVITKYNRYR
jgi:lysophospholipase L1-like esterase